MNYWLYIFSGATWDEFRVAGSSVAGFSAAQRNVANQVQPGDVLLCYISGVDRWVGALEVAGASKDRRRIWVDAEYPARFDVRPLITMNPEYGIPMEYLEGLVAFYESAKDAGKFKGFLRSSPRQFAGKQDGDLIMCLLKDAAENPVARQVDADKLGRKRAYGAASRCDNHEVTEGRQHTEIQYHLLRLGREMGFDLWVARDDRSSVWSGLRLGDLPGVVSTLPTQFNDATTRIIEYIDVLWLRGNSIAAAFEVECTTSVYSGLLRMSDLLSLQPNIDIRLFVVAPDKRRDKIEQEILRPTFRMRDKPLVEVCGFLPYDTFRKKIQTIEELKLAHSLRPAFLEQEAEYFACTK